jgi:hypothetical protein
MRQIVDVISNNPDMLMVGTLERQGGVDIMIGMTHNILETLVWVQEYKRKVEREQQLRETDPDLKHLFDQYQTVLSLKYS